MSSSASFGSERRLTHKSEYDWVFNQPDYRIRRNPCTILARRTTLELTRLGVIVGNRCARAAVERNRIKRIIRESFRTADFEGTLLDIVVIAEPSAATRSTRELSDILRESWRQLSL